MSDQPNKALLNAIDAICDRFEQAWRDGDRPDVADYFHGWNGDHAEYLLQHLLEIEFDYRLQQADTFVEQDYCRKFPQHQELVQQLAEQAQRTRATRRPTRTQYDSEIATEAPHGDATEIPETKRVSLHHREHQPRFAPGKIVDKRYRIVSRLGQGGMGEVYRADDLKLGQAVALKFLPAELSEDELLLEYFHDEVRLSRQISHPNICRTYDIGQTGGMHYLSMEYIDGENLAVLLRRIGRLPDKKAVEIAWQLCSGLQAAHSKGVLHRDLKPANVMIDGKGQARITDFGLARMADRSRDGEGLVGTPAYMAPEQYEDHITSTRSDIYSLGLILFELFTGSSARPQQSESLRNWFEEPHSIAAQDRAPQLDSRVARTITQCLQLNPMDRPDTAGGVASLLPGGDTISATLAAGDTPSPELVAAATVPASDSQSLVVAGMTSAIVLLLLAASLSTWLLHQLALEQPAAALAVAARKAAEEQGMDNPRSEAWGFSADREYLSRLVAAGVPWNRAPSDGHAAIYFWYRAGQDLMIPHRPDWSGERFLRIDEARPPVLPGDRLVRLAPDGSILSSTVLHEAADRTSQPADEAQPPSIASENPVRAVLMLIWIPALLITSVVLALRNLRLQRAYKQGATRLSCFLFCAALLSWLLSGTHVAAAEELDLFVTALAGALLLATTVWFAYVGIEPAVRRIWPRTLTSWTRLLMGQPGDPGVGREILLGIAGGCLATSLKLLIAMAPLQLGIASDAFPSFMNLQSYIGGRTAMGEVVLSLCLAILYGIFNQLLFLLILFLILRKTWLAGTAYVLFMSLLVAIQFQPFWWAFLLTLVEMTVTVVLFIRCGLLAVICMHFARLLLKFPVTLDAGSWYADSGFLAIATIAAVIAAASWLAWGMPGSTRSTVAISD